MWLWLLSMWACGDDKPATDCALEHGPVVDVPDGLCIARNFTSVAADEARLSAAVADLQRVGASALRSDVLWHVVQPQRDVWDFERYDDLLAALEAVDIELIALLAYGAPWASSETETDWAYPPDDPADFVRFAAGVAERYPGRISRYEIWNEPNAGRFWMPGIQGDPEAWGALTVAATRAIHEVDPGAEVILGGTFFPDQIIMGGAEFLSLAVAAHPELIIEADGVAVHPYAPYPPQAAPESDETGNTPLVDAVAQIREITGGMEVLISEFGWPNWGDTDAERQAHLLERGGLLAAASGVTGICWYTLWDSEDPENPEDNFGLLDVNGVRKPAAEAFGRLAEALGEATGAAMLTGLPDGAHGVHLEGVSDVVWGSGEICGQDLGGAPIWL